MSAALIERQIPWRLEEANGRMLTLVHPLMIGGDFRSELARVEVEETSERVKVGLVERVPELPGQERVGVYFVTRTVTVELRQPLGERPLDHVPVAGGAIDYAEILESEERATPSGSE